MGSLHHDLVANGHGAPRKRRGNFARLSDAYPLSSGDVEEDQALWLTELESRDEQAITHLDRAQGYKDAVDRFYGGVQSRMAEALRLSNSQLSRLLALAHLPDEVIEAFASRADLRVRHSEVLTPLLRRSMQRERLIRAARLLAQEQQHLAENGRPPIAAAAVLARLKRAALLGGAQNTGHGSVWTGQGWAAYASATSSGLAFELTLEQSADVEEVLAQMRMILVEARDRNT